VRVHQPAGPLLTIAGEREPGGELGQQERQENLAGQHDEPGPNHGAPHLTQAMTEVGTNAVNTEMSEKATAKLEKAPRLRRSCWG
jgi:hypothetical protein